MGHAALPPTACRRRPRLGCGRYSERPEDVQVDLVALGRRPGQDGGDRHRPCVGIDLTQASPPAAILGDTREGVAQFVQEELLARLRDVKEQVGMRLDPA